VDKSELWGSDPDLEDLRCIRWIGLRMDFVNAMFKAAKHKSANGSVDPMCNKKTCCAELVEIAPAIGISLFYLDEDDDATVHPELSYVNSDQAQATEVMRDALSMLKYMYWGRDLARKNPFQGYLEVPRFIGQLMGNKYFNNGWSKDEQHPRRSPNREEYLRDFVYALASAAFPDRYFNSLYGSNLNAIDSDATDSDAKILKFNAIFSARGFIPPKLTDGMYERIDLETLATSHFGDGENQWRPLAGYGLEFGMEDASLEKYWDTPGRWDAFEFFERSNGYTTFQGMIASSAVMFVNQQTAENELHEFMPLFNEFIYPVLGETPTLPGVMVVVSTYRNDAYILSEDQDAWDEYAPISRVLGPLPAGMGIVGVWRGYDKSRYTPRSIDDIIKMRNPIVSAAGRYLKECLRLLPEDS
jgi:hypothetical protein